MNIIDSPCSIKIKHKVIVLQEKKSRFCIENSREETYHKITIDSCVITSGMRCDYIIITPDNTEIFIELKGSDIEHAASQLKETYTKLKSEFKSKNKEFFIISPRSPLSGTAIQELKKKFKKETGYMLELKRSPCDYK